MKLQALVGCLLLVIVGLVATLLVRESASNRAQGEAMAREEKMVREIERLNLVVDTQKLLILDPAAAGSTPKS